MLIIQSLIVLLNHKTKTNENIFIMKKADLINGKKFILNSDSNFGVYELRSAEKNPYLVEFIYSKNLDRFLGDENHCLNIVKITNTYLIGYNYVLNKKVTMKLRLEDLTQFNK